MCTVCYNVQFQWKMFYISPSRAVVRPWSRTLSRSSRSMFSLPPWLLLSFLSLFLFGFFFTPLSLSLLSWGAPQYENIFFFSPYPSVRRAISPPSLLAGCGAGESESRTDIIDWVKKVPKRGEGGKETASQGIENAKRNWSLLSSFGKRWSELIHSGGRISLIAPV